MRTDIKNALEPAGIYTGTQAIAATGISERTFYRYVRQGKIPKHKLEINGKSVYLGHELLSALTTLKRPLVYFVKPKRGRPKKEV